MTAPKPKTAVVHLELMSKPRLVELARTAQSRVDAAHAEADRQAALVEYWKGYAERIARYLQSGQSEPITPVPIEYAHTGEEWEWETARLLLAGIPADPFAEDHLEDLDDAIREPGTDPKRRSSRIYHSPAA